MARRVSRTSAIASPVLSDRLLSERLREFEAQGLVAREVIPAAPVQVRYSLTEMARELLPAIQLLVDWSHKWLHAPNDDQRKFGGP